MVIIMNEKYPLEKLEQIIGYVFRDTTYLKQAMTHSSYANEKKIFKVKDYERLEFLGDAVLELVSSEFLFKAHPEMPEGKLTKLRSSCVCQPAVFAYCGRALMIYKENVSDVYFYNVQDFLNHFKISYEDIV